MSDLNKYYFLSNDKIYIVEMNDEREETFLRFYLEVMARNEDNFFANPTKEIEGARTQKDFRGLTVEELTKDRLNKLLDKVGKFRVFDYNIHNLYDYYDSNNCQLYRKALAVVLNDPYYDFIPAESIALFIERDL